MNELTSMFSTQSKKTSFSISFSINHTAEEMFSDYSSIAFLLYFSLAEDIIPLTVEIMFYLMVEIDWLTGLFQNISEIMNLGTDNN